MTTWTLHEGNCLDFLPEYAGMVDLVVTSPPYDNLRDYGGHGFAFDEVADALVPTLKPGGVLVWVVADATIDGSETGTSFWQAMGFMERGLRLHDTMIYEKALPNNPTPNRYGQVFEYMFVLPQGAPGRANLLRDRENVTGGEYRPTDHGTGRGKDGTRASRPNKTGAGRALRGRRTNIWRYKVGIHQSAPDFLDAHDHPAIFPYALAADHIQTWTDPGDLVLDPMAGSGTTMRAALDLGRRPVGMEIHPPYCDLIRRRMAQGVLV